MIDHREASWWYLLNGVCRYAIVHGILPISSHVTVNEFPKSGGTWLSQMLSEALNLPFPQNRLPTISGCIMHGHYGKSWPAKNMVVVWRDGRDITVSMYYHYLFQNDKGNPRITRIIGDKLNFSDVNDIHSNLPRFIEFIFSDKVTPRFSWAEHVDAWRPRPVQFVKYESLRLHAVDELRRLCNAFAVPHLDEALLQGIVQKYSFENQSGRKPGQENKSSFIRKGIVGDWKNSFSQSSREAFDFYAGRQLIDLEYEPDSSWVKSPYRL